VSSNGWYLKRSREVARHPTVPKSLWFERLVGELFKPFSAAVRSRSREPLFLRMLREGLPRGATLLEIGSSDGCEAIEAVRRCGADRVVIAEPHLANIERAKDAVRRARVPLDRLTFDNCAIAETTGRHSFHLHPRNANLNSAISPIEGGSSVDVDFYSLSDFIEKHRLMGPLLIKMDIEGYEVDVIRGAMDLLATRPGIGILMELHPVRYEGTRSMVKTMEALMSYGYEAALLESAGEPVPVEFAEAGLSPAFVSGTRGLYRGVPNMLALSFCSQLHGQTPRKIARSVLLVRK
jgi:FkbM family methyltransferase